MRNPRRQVSWLAARRRSPGLPAQSDSDRRRRIDSPPTVAGGSFGLGDSDPSWVLGRIAAPNSLFGRARPRRGGRDTGATFRDDTSAPEPVNPAPRRRPGAGGVTVPPSGEWARAARHGMASPRRACDDGGMTDRLPDPRHSQDAGTAAAALPDGGGAPHGGDLAAAAARWGTAAAGWTDLSTGINPWPWPWPVPVEQAAPPAELWTRLPASADLARLTAAAASAYGARGPAVGRGRSGHRGGDPSAAAAGAAGPRRCRRPDLWRPCTGLAARRPCGRAARCPSANRIRDAAGNRDRHPSQQPGRPAAGPRRPAGPGRRAGGTRWAPRGRRGVSRMSSPSIPSPDRRAVRG